MSKFVFIHAGAGVVTAWFLQESYNNHNVSETLLAHPLG